jgi:hypothetical protein
MTDFGYPRPELELAKPFEERKALYWPMVMAWDGLHDAAWFSFKPAQDLIVQRAKEGLFLCSVVTNEKEKLWSFMFSTRPDEYFKRPIFEALR